MLATRIIPILLLRNESLIKTVKFRRYTYIGDPCNTVRIFNELEVDELICLDVSATKEHRKPNIALLSDLANECFMPLGYGGGVTSVEEAAAIFKIGFEKIALNSVTLRDPSMISRMADRFGSQAIVVSIDVRRNIFGVPKVISHCGAKPNERRPAEWARELEALGAGEILLTSVDREGTWQGLDLELIRSVTSAVNIPVIAHGGAGSLEHIRDAVKLSSASAVGLGSMVVFQKKGMGVLINMPDQGKLDAMLR